MKTQEVYIFVFKTTWKSYLKNNEKNTWKFTKKNLEKSWKYHGILSVRKSGNPVVMKYKRGNLFKWFSIHLIYTVHICTCTPLCP